MYYLREEPRQVPHKEVRMPQLYRYMICALKLCPEVPSIPLSGLGTFLIGYCKGFVVHPTPGPMIGPAPLLLGATGLMS